MTARYCLAVERRGTADYYAMVFRGPRLVTDAYSHRPDLALRNAVQHARHLRRSGWLAVAQSQATGDSL